MSRSYDVLDTYTGCKSVKFLDRQNSLVEYQITSLKVIEGKLPVTFKEWASTGYDAQEH